MTDASERAREIAHAYSNHHELSRLTKDITAALDAAEARGRNPEMTDVNERAREIVDHPDNGCPYVADDESDLVLADYGTCACRWMRRESFVARIAAALAAEREAAEQELRAVYELVRGAAEQLAKIAALRRPASGGGK